MSILTSCYRHITLFLFGYLTGFLYFVCNLLKLRQFHSGNYGGNYQFLL